MAEPNRLARRDFVKVVVAVLGTIMGAVIALPAIGYILSPALAVQKKEAWVPLGPLDNFPFGIPTLVSFTRSKINGWEKTVNSFGVYVIRYDDANHQALSNMCTHLSCRVTWQEDISEYRCPCHDGFFAIDGEVISGPPPAPMYEYETKVEDGVLFVHFEEG